MISIDKNKLQIKHITNVYKKLEGYPTPLDVLYDSCIESSDESLFTQAKMENRYNISEERISDITSYLLESGYVEKKGSKYKIITTPWQ